MKCTSNANDSTFITLCFFIKKLINLGSYLLIMKIFSQYSIIMSDKRMLEDFPMEKPLRFLSKRNPKTHSVIRALGLGNPHGDEMWSLGE